MRKSFTNEFKAKVAPEAIKEKKRLPSLLLNTKFAQIKLDYEKLN